MAPRSSCRERHWADRQQKSHRRVEALNQPPRFEKILQHVLVRQVEEPDAIRVVAPRNRARRRWKHRAAFDILPSFCQPEREHNQRRLSQRLPEFFEVSLTRALHQIGAFKAVGIHRGPERIEKPPVPFPNPVLGREPSTCFLRQLQKLPGCVYISVPR